MMDTGGKVKFPRSVVESVLFELQRLFDPVPAMGRPNALANRICAVGGYRRGKAEMKDLELLYVPRMAAVVDPADMFGSTVEVNVTERLIDGLVKSGVFAKRLKVTGTISAWGPWNKHAVHVPSGLPIDLFATAPENWANRLVVTTGPREHNVMIAIKAREMGWEWEVGEGGFVPLGKTWANAKERRTMREEADVFRFVELPFKRPEERR